MNQSTHLKNIKTALENLAITLEDGITLTSLETRLDAIVTSTDIVADCVTANLLNAHETNSDDIKLNTSNTVSGITSLIEPITTLGTTVYSSGASKGLNISAVRNEASLDLCAVDGRAAPIAVDSTGRVLTDVRRIAASPVEVNSGSLSGGTQRICIATNDIPVALVNTNLGTINTSIGTGNTSLGSIQTNTSNLGLCRDFITGVSVLRTASVDELGVSHNINFEDGNIEAGTQRVCIATDDINLANVNTNLGTINTSIGTSNTSLSTVNTNLGTINTSIGTGNTSLGTIDSNAALLAGTINSTTVPKIRAQLVDGSGNGVVINTASALNSVVVALRNQDSAGAPQWNAFNSGNLNAGVMRVCLATNDVNISRLLVILEDVYDDAAGCLKVKVIP